MTSVTRVLVPFLLLLLAAVPAAWSQDGSLYVVRDSAGTLVGPPSAIPENAWLEVHFVDVGHGDGIWIDTDDDGMGGNASSKVEASSST